VWIYAASARSTKSASTSLNGSPRRCTAWPAPFPKLVVSGGHSEPFDAVCDVLEERLGAERAVFPGAGHAVQRLGEPFNDVLADFVERAEAA